MLALELGGNNPLIVHELGDVEAAVETTIHSAYLTAGQRCTCARRLIVTEQAPERFVDNLAERVGKVRVGSPFEDPPPFMGPLIRPAAARAVLAAQQALIDRGAEPLCPCEPYLAGGDGFVTPVLVDVTGVEREDE